MATSQITKHVRLSKQQNVDISWLSICKVLLVICPHWFRYCPQTYVRRIPLLALFWQHWINIQHFNTLSVNKGVRFAPKVNALFLKQMSYLPWAISIDTLQWRHNGSDVASDHQPYDCLLNRLFRFRSKKISKLRVAGLCAGKSPVTGEFRAQMASNVDNVSIWWRHLESCQ